MPRVPVHHVVSPRVWRVMTSPVRFEILEAMRMIAPCSIAEIAEILDRPADSLYRHVDQLAQGGFLTCTGTRNAGRRPERVFDLTADDFRPAFKDPSGRAANAAYHDSIATICKIVQRSSRDASAASGLMAGGEGRNILGFLGHAWLAPEEFDEVCTMLREVMRYLDARATPGRGRLFVTGVATLPVVRKRGARKRTSARAVASKSAAQAATRTAPKPSSKPSSKSSPKPSTKTKPAR